MEAAAAAAAKEETNNYIKKKPQQRDDVTGLKTPLAKGDEPDTCFPSSQQLSQRSSLMINHLVRSQAERTAVSENACRNTLQTWEKKNILWGLIHVILLYTNEEHCTE